MLDTGSSSSSIATTILSSKSTEIVFIPKKEAKSLRALLKTKAKYKFVEDWDFAKLLWVSKTISVESGTTSEKFYKYCGYNTWRDYCKQEIGLDTKSADRYVKTYQKFGVDLSSIFNKKHITHLSKMYKLIPLVTDSNVNEIFEEVKDLDASKYDKLVGFDANHDKSVVSYQVTKQAKKNFKRAISFGKQDFGNLNDGVIMHKIVKFYIDNRKDVLGS